MLDEIVITHDDRVGTNLGNGHTVVGFRTGSLEEGGFVSTIEFRPYLGENIAYLTEWQQIDRSDRYRRVWGPSELGMAIWQTIREPGSDRYGPPEPAPYAGCDPTDVCQVEGHTSLDCYPQYVHLEYEGPGSRVMTWEEWQQV